MSVFKDLKFLSFRSFICLVRVIPRRFILLEAIVKGVFMISFSVHSSFAWKRATDILELILYLTTLLKVYIKCRSSLVEVLGSLMHTIIPSTNYGTLTSSFQFVSPSSPLVVLLLQLQLQILYLIGRGRVNKRVLFLILVEYFLVSPHLIWCWVEACCELPLLCL